jgi:hypothetical protein
VVETGVTGRRRGRAGALPGVQADVVMIAAGRQKRGAGRIPELQGETQRLGVEGTDGCIFTWRIISVRIL